MKKTKKLVSLLLVLVMCASLAACGSKDNTTSGTPSNTPSSAPSSADGPTDAQLQALTDAYNQVAVLYNDVAITADANGWTADEETYAALQTIGAMMDPVGQALAGDMSALAGGANFDTLPGALLELLPELEALSEKVAVPYEGGSGDGADAQFDAVTDAYNQVADIFNDVVDTAEANGWTADPDTMAIFEIVNATLAPVGQALSGDMSALEGFDLDQLTSTILEYVPELQQLKEQVSVPYGDVG